MIIYLMSTIETIYLLSDYLVRKLLSNDNCRKLRGESLLMIDIAQTKQSQMENCYQMWAKLW